MVRFACGCSLLFECTWGDVSDHSYGLFVRVFADICLVASVIRVRGLSGWSVGLLFMEVFFKSAARGSSLL
jgi:hypothetical protein